MGLYFSAPKDLTCWPPSAQGTSVSDVSLPSEQAPSAGLFSSEEGNLRNHFLTLSKNILDKGVWQSGQSAEFQSMII